MAGAAGGRIGPRQGPALERRQLETQRQVGTLKGPGCPRQRNFGRGGGWEKEVTRNDSGSSHVLPGGVGFGMSAS